MKRLFLVCLLSCGVVGQVLSKADYNIDRLGSAAAINGACASAEGGLAVGALGGACGFGANIVRNYFQGQKLSAHRYVKMGFLIGTGFMGLVEAKLGSVVLEGKWSLDSGSTIAINKKELSFPEGVSYCTAYLVASAGMVGASTWGLVRMVLRK